MADWPSTYLEPGLLALSATIDTGVCWDVSVWLGSHKGGEAKPELADV